MNDDLFPYGYCVNAIFATDLNGGMGYKGSMPWPRLRQDLANFQKTTKNNFILMGSKTWCSTDMGNPLPMRKSIVWSRNPQLLPNINDQVAVVSGDPRVCLDLLRTIYIPYRGEIWVIGGAETLKAWMPLVQKVTHTEIHGVWECDVHYTKSQWADEFGLEKQNTITDPLNQITYTITTWERCSNGTTVS